MRVAVAHCALFSEPSPSNAAFVAALRGRGASVSTPRWNREPLSAFVEPDLVVLRQTWDYQLDAAGFAAWASAATLAGARFQNPAPVAIWNNDKRTLMELAARGVDCPATADLDRLSPEDAAEWIGGETFVLKPAYGGGGHGVRRATRATLKADLAATRLEAPGRPLMLQAFLPEIADGEWSLVFIDNVFSHAVRKTPGAGEFRVNNRFAPQIARAEPPRGVVETAAAILGHVPATLLAARIDGVLRDGRFVCTELELTDPELHLDLFPDAAERLADAALIAANR